MWWNVLRRKIFGFSIFWFDRGRLTSGWLGLVRLFLINPPQAWSLPLGTGDMRHSSLLFWADPGSLNVTGTRQISSPVISCSQQQNQEYLQSIFLVSRDIWSWRIRHERVLFPDDVTRDPAIACGHTKLFRAETKWNVNHHYPHIPDHIVNNFFPPLRPLCFGSINCNSYVFLALIFTLDFILIVVIFYPKPESTDHCFIRQKNSFPFYFAARY